MSTETIKYRVKIDFPWSMHKIGDIISVYKSTGMAYVVGSPGDYDDYNETGKEDLRDYPEIYELIKSNSKH